MEQAILNEIWALLWGLHVLDETQSIWGFCHIRVSFLKNLKLQLEGITCGWKLTASSPDPCVRLELQQLNICNEFVLSTIAVCNNVRNSDCYFFGHNLVSVRMRVSVRESNTAAAGSMSLSKLRSPAATYFTSNGLKIVTLIIEYWKTKVKHLETMMICATGISKWSGLTHFHASSAKISTKPVLKLHKPEGRWVGGWTI